MYLTLLGPIIAGVVNSMFCKTKLFPKLKKPMDFGKCLKDKKRIFGDHKTFKGFLGYIFFNIVFALLCGLLCNIFHINKYNFFYINHSNTILYNILIGFLLGLFYALFELPNSFIKRRLDIEPGKTVTGFKKIFFVFLDQADSVFGVALVVWMFYPIGIWIYLLYVVIGAGTHLLLNMMLYFMHFRKNMF
jgi:hypothetical protein